MFNKIWDAETVIAAILGEILAGNDISYSATKKRVPSLLRAGERAFGSWRKAIEAAGLNYEDIKKYRTWSEERVIAVIQAHAKEGHDLSWGNTKTVLDPSLTAAALNYFDDWHKALEAAGLNPELIAKYKRWSLESIEEELRLRVEEGAEVGYTSIKETQRGILDATYRRVESFAKLRKSVVGEPPTAIKKMTIIENNQSILKPENRESWTKEKIVEEIKNRANQNLPLNYKAILVENRPLLRAGERHFGKWSNAVEEAGICYDSIRLVQHWNHEKVIDCIKNWKEIEENLNYTHVAQKLDAKLAAAAIRKSLFDSWDKALFAAGVDPDSTRTTTSWTLGKVMMRLSILQEYGIELKTNIIKSYAPDLMAAVYYYIGSLTEARKILKELDIPNWRQSLSSLTLVVLARKKMKELDTMSINKEIGTESIKEKNDLSETIENNQNVDLSSTELLLTNE